MKIGKTKNEFQWLDGPLSDMSPWITKYKTWQRVGVTRDKFDMWGGKY